MHYICASGFIIIHITFVPLVLVIWRKCVHASVCVVDPFTVSLLSWLMGAWQAWLAWHACFLLTWQRLAFRTNRASKSIKECEWGFPSLIYSDFVIDLLHKKLKTWTLWFFNYFILFYLLCHGRMWSLCFETSTNVVLRWTFTSMAQQTNVHFISKTS